jgi:hypothetical protein
MYYNFNRALVESERPGDLNSLELEQYELAIEEQAYPFEEKAIQIHEKNLELLSLGIYSTWIESSFGKLAKLIPARYAKFEESSGYISTIDNPSYKTLTDPAPIIVNIAPAPVAIPPQQEIIPETLPAPVAAPVQSQVVAKPAIKSKKAVKSKKGTTPVQGK